MIKARAGLLGSRSRNMTTGKRQRVGLRKRGDGGERARTKRRVGAHVDG